MTDIEFKEKLLVLLEAIRAELNHIAWSQAKVG